MSNTKHINIVSCITFCLFGGFYAGHQLLVNNIVAAFGGGDTQLATLTTCTFLGTLIMVLLFGEITQRFGKKIGICLSVLLMAAGCALILFSSGVIMAAAGMLIYSMGAGGFESGLYAMLTDLNGERTARLLLVTQMLFSLGAFLSPIILGYTIPADQFRPAYLVFTVLISLFFVFFATIKLPLSIAQTQNDADEPKAEKSATVTLLKKPFILLCLLSMILFIGCESAATFWVVSLFDSFNYRELGALALSAYWLASIFGRLVCARLTRIERAAPYAIIASIAGLLLILLVPNPYIKFTGVIILGLTMSPLYPIINYLGGNAYPRYAAAAFSLIIFSASLGGVISQPIFGAVANASGTQTVYWLVVGLLGVLFFLLSYVIRLKGKMDAEKAAVVT